MALLLEVEFLAGFCAAATGPDNETAEWPIEGDRLFSALVASWGARGCRPEEADALRWLERQPAPRVRASDWTQRSSETFFVPPNDPSTPVGDLVKLKWYREYLSLGKPIPKSKETQGIRREWLQALSVMPVSRRRQPRRFAVARPEEAVVRYSWRAEPEPALLEALDRLARDTAYLGASRSLVRCRFLQGEEEGNRPVGRWVYRGRLDELERRFEAGRRASPGVPVFSVAAEDPVEPVAASVFSDGWLVLEHVGGEMPALLACALVARTIRDAILSGYRREGLGDSVPEVVSGHGPDGSPTRAPHLAIVPLAFVGFPYADGRVLGYALVPPRGSGLLEDETFRRVLRRLAPIDEERGHRVLTVATPAGTEATRAFRIELAPRSDGAGRRSLDPGLYTRPARRFASVTPILLDRHLKSRGAERREEIAGLVVSACERIGLPRPVAVEADRHGAVEGAPSVRMAGAPEWTRWRLPDELSSRQLVHAVLEFAAPVRGPVLLGAGRFCGLGLLRPVP